MVIIGITGQTGAGKTTALQAILQLGGHIIDGDQVYHRLLAESVPLREELECHFGPLTQEDGTFDRKKLGGIVFADSVALEALNAITHRHIMAAVAGELGEARSRGCPVAAMDAIRLVESGLSDLCHSVVAITASPQVRVERIMARENITREYAQARVDAQQSESFYIANAQYVLRSDHTTSAQLEAEAKKIFETILSEFGGK